MSDGKASVASVPALGLVSYSTSETPTSAPNIPRTLDTKKARFSRMSRAVMKGAALHALNVQSAYTRKNASIMATLTYRESVTPQKGDVIRLLQLARKWAKRKGFELRYVWTAELTKKGKLHYHVLFFLPPRQRLPMFDRNGWWKHGMTRLEWARNAVQYIAKYASKGGGAGRNRFPKGFRLHGCGGLNKTERNERRYHLAPAWVRIMFDLDEKPKPCVGGGWFSMTSGLYQSSPFYIISATAGRVVVGCKKWFADLLETLPKPELNPCLN